jgi:GNAT superfamily N-acetyltransferase
MDYDSAVLERVAQLFRYEMWKSVVPVAVTECGIEVQRFGPVQATAVGAEPEVPSLNQIQGAAEPGAVEGGHLADAIEWMRTREVDYRVPVAESRPGSAEAEAWLGGHGYERAAAPTKLVRDAAPPDLPEDPEIEIFALGEEIDGEGLSHIVREGLGLPIMAETLVFSLPMEESWRCYTAVLPSEDRVAATGSMLIHDGVAQLGLDATLEVYRGRGCNRALLRRRLLDAAEAGCHTVFAELGECEPAGLAAARQNLVDAGFEEAYCSRSWQRPALMPAAAGSGRRRGG